MPCPPNPGSDFEPGIQGPMETTRQQDLRQLLHQQQLISQQLAQLMQAEAAAEAAGNTIPTEAELQRMPDPPQAVLDEVHRARPPTQGASPRTLRCVQFGKSFWDAS